MRCFFIAIIFCSGFCSCFAGTGDTIIAITETSVPAAYFNLRLRNDSISRNDLLNEEILDLVRVAERDSLIPTKWTTHQLRIFNWLVRSLGYYWKPVDGKRHKFVGTQREDNIRIPGNEDRRTEHDVNFNLIPHIPYYQDQMYAWIETQLGTRKGSEHDRTQAPYIYPTDSTLHLYRMHNELTPPKRQRDSLTELFFPCLNTSNVSDHNSFCDPRPSVGMYGPLVLDCNHSCHPEIHPYEWLWWLDLTVKGGNKIDPKHWMAGFFRESSNRFNAWSRLPRVGSISIPFVFRTHEINSYFYVTHLLKTNFISPGIYKMPNAPKKAADFNFTEITLSVKLNDHDYFPIVIRTNKALKTKAIRWWMSEVKTDMYQEWVWGKLNIAVSIADGYAARIECVTLD